MSHLFICNTSSDCISRINLSTFKEENKITLNNGYHKIGPHGICRYKDNLITANSYSNSISIIDTTKNIEIQNCFIGMHCNDVVTVEDYAYIVCGELNNIVVFDIVQNKVVEEIPCGNLPHNIQFNEKNNLFVVSNMGNDTLTLISAGKKGYIKNIKVGPYPIKALFTRDGEHIVVCESNLGSDQKGSISILSTKNLRVLYRIPVGNSPVDMFIGDNVCYVSNFGDGTLSFVDINYYEETNRIKIGGMPRGIVKEENELYVGDNYNNILIKIDLESGNKKNIPIGGEPTGMILI